MNSQSLALILWLLASVAIYGTHAQGGHVNIPFPGFNAKLIGHEIDLDSGEILDRCIGGKKVLIKNPHLRTRLLFDQSTDELNRNLFGQASFGVNLGVLAGGTSMEILKTLSKSKLSMTVFLHTRYHHGTVTSIPVSEGSKDFHCEKPYVRSYRLGASLIVSLRVKAKNLKYYRRIRRTTSSSALWGLIKKGSTNTKEVLKNLQGSKIQLRIVPLGFKGSELEKLPTAVSCPLNEFEKCLSVAERVFELMGPLGGFKRAVNAAIDSETLFVSSINVEQAYGTPVNPTE